MVLVPGFVMQPTVWCHADRVARLNGTAEQHIALLLRVCLVTTLAAVAAAPAGSCEAAAA